MGKTQMAPGGGLSTAKLALATAQPGQVLAGQTFYAGDKQLKTGTLTSGRIQRLSLGTGTSFNLASLLPNHYRSLTSNNFGVGSVDVYAASHSPAGIGDISYTWDFINWSYNAETGVLTVGNTELKKDPYNGTRTISASVSPSMYVYYIE